MAGPKCYQKGTLGTRRGVPRSREVPLGLSGGLREEHGPVKENWGPQWSRDGVWKERSERKRVGMMQRSPNIALEKVRRKRLCCPPPVSIVVFFSLFS